MWLHFLKKKKKLFYCPQLRRKKQKQKQTKTKKKINGGNIWFTEGSLTFRHLCDLDSVQLRATSLFLPDCHRRQATVKKKRRKRRNRNRKRRTGRFGKEFECLTGFCWAGPCCTRFRCLDASLVVRRYSTSAIRRIASLCKTLFQFPLFLFCFFCRCTVLQYTYCTHILLSLTTTPLCVIFN